MSEQYLRLLRFEVAISNSFAHESLGLKGSQSI